MEFNQKDVAFKNLQKALIETTPIKRMRKRVESFIKREIDAPPWSITAVAVGASAASSGKVSTDKFKN